MPGGPSASCCAATRPTAAPWAQAWPWVRARRAGRGGGVAAARVWPPAAARRGRPAHARVRAAPALVLGRQRGPQAAAGGLPGRAARARGLAGPTRAASWRRTTGLAPTRAVWRPRPRCTPACCTTAPLCPARPAAPPSSSASGRRWCACRRPHTARLFAPRAATVVDC